MKKWLLYILLAAVFLTTPQEVLATDATAYDTVYVAGNPDLYPFEYYDTHSNSYQGILPEIYKQISKAENLEFVYIHPGLINQQQRLAKNSQVDLISAYVKGEINAPKDEFLLLRVDENTEICIGFTAITPSQSEALLIDYLEQLSDQQLLELAIGLENPLPEKKFFRWGGMIGGLLLLIIVTLVIILLQQHIEKKKKNDVRLIDSLTGIGNTLYFENTYQCTITPNNYALYYLSYISMDISRIERYAGEGVAEEIQRYAADVLSQSAAEQDFTARIGEGTFLLAFQAPTEEIASVRTNEVLKILNEYESSFLEKHRVLFRAGIYQIESANLPVETAVFNARQGYNAAFHNQCAYIFTDKNMLSREATKVALSRELSSALKNREFLLYLQMIVDRDGNMIGAEALTRWQNKEKGIISPGEFIEPLKDAGLMDKLDFCILEEVCNQLEQWHLTGKEHLWISCNFSRVTMSREDFMARFQDITERYQFAPDRLIIELTEDSLMDNSAVAYRNILGCKDIGCQIALDDLGSGYSSLQDLCDYPIDMFKIDRHILLKSITPKGNALLHGLVKLGHDLGIKVLCEGVETEEENRNVREAGCDYIQGFYYSRVLPRDEANLFYMRKQQERSTASS